ENRCVTWTLNAIGPGESRQQKFTVAARAAGTIDLRADAWDRNGSTVSAVRGISVEPAFDPTLSFRLSDDGFREARNGTHHATGLEPPVLFSVGDTEFAVPICHVVEIGRPAATTPVPNGPDWLLGTTKVRGEVVSMVDLGQFLNLPRNGPRTRVLLARA